MSEKRALYFGSINHSGHFLHSDGNERMTLRPKQEYPGFPWEIEHLDTGLLRNRKVPDKPTGEVSWTCGGKPVLWHAFFWWDRSDDSRPGSNSGFYVSGFGLNQALQAYAFATAAWPAIVVRQNLPLQLRG